MRGSPLPFVASPSFSDQNHHDTKTLNTHIMNSETTYNGWTNYETWLVKLWQDNDQGEQEYWQDVANDTVKTDGKEEAVGVMARIMQDHYKEAGMDLAGVTGMWADMLNAALCSVSWYEIAQAWVDEVEVETATA